MTPIPVNELDQLLLDIAISTARLRAMTEEAHALVERLERRPSVAPIKVSIRLNNNDARERPA